MNKSLSLAAAHWDKLQKFDWLSRRSRWWHSASIIRHINRHICGQALDGITAGDIALLKSRYPSRKFAKAVSIGCGNGSKELELVKAGLVEHFDLFEISSASIKQGRILAKNAAAGSAMSFHQLVVDMTEPTDIAKYDLVYWNNALHHMLDVPQAMHWSKAKLKAGGVIYINDFIGPDRMQWTPEMLHIASSVRASLPKRMLRHPLLPWRKLPTQVTAVSVADIIRIDPTECADSARMLHAFKESFHGGLIIPTGGLVYHTALNDVIGNINETRHAHIMKLLLLLDDMTITHGLSQYCVMVGDKGYDHYVVSANTLSLPLN